MQLAYLNVETTEPDYNLALEQYVFDRLPRDREYFMLWQNDNAVIVGKHQNTYAEINAAAVKSRGVRVVRRLSGGGAVYHDLGNLNFTFIADAQNSEAIAFDLFCQPIVRTLEALGVKAEVNGRNDITIAGKKFSGNAQYRREGRVMHHGTILFCSDLSVVEEVLRVDADKIRAKGMRSVHSRVTNVAEHLSSEISLQTFRQMLLQNVIRNTGAEEYVLSGDDRAAIESLRRERYSTREWNYGASPVCSFVRRRRVEGCGLVEAYITVDGGRISRLEFQGDFFSVLEPSALAERFSGQPPTREGYGAAIEGQPVPLYFSGLSGEMLLELLAQD